MITDKQIDSHPKLKVEVDLSFFSLDEFRTVFTFQKTQILLELLDEWNDYFIENEIVVNKNPQTNTIDLICIHSLKFRRRAEDVLIEVFKLISAIRAITADEGEIFLRTMRFLFIKEQFESDNEFMREVTYWQQGDSYYIISKDFEFAFSILKELIEGVNDD